MSKSVPVILLRFSKSDLPAKPEHVWNFENSRLLIGFVMAEVTVAVGSALGCSFRRILPIPVLVMAVVLASAAAAAEAGRSGAGPSEVTFIAELILLMLVGRLMGEFMLRVGQPAVVGQLIGGLVLGPSVLGLVWPAAEHALFPSMPEQNAMIGAVSQLGILLLLLLTGMETDLKLVRKVGRAAIGVSIAGIAVPFALGFALGEFIPENLLPQPGARLISSLFLGTAMSISSVKIVALVVREMNFMRRDVGQLILASAIIDDTIGWIIIAIIFSLAESGHVDARGLLTSILGTLAFLALSLTIGRKMVAAAIRWSNDRFLSEFSVITTILIIMGAMAIATQLIGVHSVLGAFIAGVLIGESPILTRHIDDQLRGLITALFAPVFFGMAGLGTDLTVLSNPQLSLLLVEFIAIASLGKFGGAYLGSWLGGVSAKGASAIGFGMNARGSTEVIVASIGLSLGLLSHDLYTIIVGMAVVTTMAMPPSLRWALARLPMSEQERIRLEREEFDERGFISNLERLLVGAGDGASGHMASRIAGLLAGAYDIPTTVVSLEPHTGTLPEKPEPGVQQNVEVKQEARAAKARVNHANPGETKSETDVIAVTGAEPGHQTVVNEARKGYDLLVVGDGAVDDDAAFSSNVNKLAMDFGGPVILARARGLKSQGVSGFRSILVPVTGTEHSQRAAEVSMAMARATRAKVTVLYVRPEAKMVSPGRVALNALASENAIMDAIARLRDRFEVNVHTVTQSHKNIALAINEEVKRGHHQLIVLGVNRRLGETLQLGDTANELLVSSTVSMLFVAGGRNR